MKSTPLVELETPRLLLRRWLQADLEPFTRLNADAETMRYFPEPYSAKHSKDMFGRIEREFSECGFGLYAVEEKASGSFIGFTGFHRATMETSFCPCIEIGWRLDKSRWNRGYASEAAAACLRHGFTALGFDAVYSFTAVSNLPSQRVMRKIGMELALYFDHPALPESSPLRPHVCYRIDKNSYAGS